MNATQLTIPRPPVGAPKAGRSSVVVIGGGLGGLAAGVRLAASGMRVTLVEQAPTLGGRAAQIRDRGYTFDVGPSLITMPQVLDDLFTAAGTTTARELELRRLEPFYRIHWRGEPRHFDFQSNRELMLEEIAKFSRDDARRYDDFIAASRRIHEDAVLAAGARDFLRLSSFLQLVPRMVRLNALRTVAGFVGSFFREPHVQQAFNFHPLFIGGDPFRVPAVYAALAYLQIEDGVWYATGGVHSMVQALARVFLSLGGTVITGQRVEEVLQKDGRVIGVRTESGDALGADYVVSNADVDSLSSLLGRPLNESHRTMSCFLLYVGVARKLPLKHHTLLVGSDYRRFIADVTRSRRLPEDVSLYLHAPSVTDPGMAPAGGESLSILLPVPNLGLDVDWERAGEELRSRVLTALESAEGLALGGLSEGIEVEQRWDPRDFRDRLGAVDGNAFGPEPTLLQSAYFRQPNRDRHVEGLYHVGAGTHPGAGIPGVMLGAEVTTRLLLEEVEARR